MAESSFIRTFYAFALLGAAILSLCDGFILPKVTISSSLLSPSTRKALYSASGDSSDELPGDLPGDEVFDENVPRLNSVTLIGRTGSDPMARFFDSGKVVCTVSLAVKREYHPIERQALQIAYGEEETDWFTLEFWDRTAEYVIKVVEKGTRIGVSGSLVIDKWTDKATGEPRQKAKIRCDTFELLESKVEREARRANKSGGGEGGSYSSSNNKFKNNNDAGERNDIADLPSFFDDF